MCCFILFSGFSCLFFYVCVLITASIFVFYLFLAEMHFVSRAVHIFLVCVQTSFEFFLNFLSKNNIFSDTVINLLCWWFNWESFMPIKTIEEEKGAAKIML